MSGEIKLQVTMINTWATDCMLREYQELIPFARRQVTIELTPEQVAQLNPKEVGTNGNKAVFENFGHVWLEVTRLGEGEK